MPVHFITLRSLSKELHDSLQGATIIEVFSQQKNELCVTCLKETQESTLCISVESKMNYCVLRTEFSRARKNSVDLFPTLAGKTIKQISLHSTDRIIIIEVESGVRLYLRLYNSAASNIVLIDSEHGVAESFKHDKELLGKQLTISSRGDWELLKDVQRFSEAMKQHDEKSVEESLRKAIPMFGALYSREILFRSGVDATRIVQSLNDGEMQTLFDAVTNILLEFDDAHPIIYYEEEKPSILSMIQLRHCNEMSAKQFGSVNEAVRLMIGQSFRTKSFSEKKNELLDGVRRVLAQTERNLKAIEKELASSERAQEYERIGHSIMANLHNITKGMKQIVLPDVFDGQKQLSIQLEPSLTPYQNAEKYFEKARKAKLSRSESEERLQSQQEQIKQLQQLIDELSACSTSDELKDFSSRNRERLLFIKTEKTEEEKIPFRVFTVAGGFEVWVGKSSANNDLLTTKYAKPNDLWFHARGVGGSHTVLKTSGGKVPPREAIQQAASIAAYYSKMRNANNVAVAYCERKYVRKPKGVHEGTVFLEREEVVFVEPRLP